MRRPRSVGKAVGAISAVSVAALIAGCSSGGSTPAAGTAAQASASAAVVTGTRACSQYGNNVNLTVGVSETGQTIAQSDQKLADEFEAQYPGVHVTLQVKDFSDALATIKLAMSSNDPPDLMQGNEGWSIDGALWQAGLIMNLDKYAKAYNWYKDFPASALSVNEFSSNGKVFGSGDLTGLPQGIQYVGVFYNKALLKKIGITNPQSLSDSQSAFLAAIKKAKAAGLTPVMLGDADKNWALHNLSLFNGWYLTPQQINPWVFNTPGTTYDNAGDIQGATDLQDWMKDGYFNSDALGITFDQAENEYGQGKAVFFVTGTWALGDLEQSMGSNVGFMLWPAGETGKHEAVGGYSLPYVISSKTKYPDCAAALLNFMTNTTDAFKAQVDEAGRPPAATAGLNVPISDPLLQQMTSQYKILNSEDGMFTWEDWPTPTMLTYSGTEAQLLIAGTLSPQQYVSDIQQNWQQYMDTRSS